MSIDSAGNIFVADTGNSAIRKITSAGIVSTLSNAAGIFSLPYDVATDSTGNVYVASTYNNTIGKIMANGGATTLAGTPAVGGRADGTGAAARFNFPMGIAADGAGNVYVADTDNNVIRKITPEGVVTTVVGTPAIGFAAGPLPGGLVAPVGVALHGTSLYIATGNGIAVVSNLP
jgi:streptogramin lyase